MLNKHFKIQIRIAPILFRDFKGDFLGFSDSNVKNFWEISFGNYLIFNFESKQDEKLKKLEKRFFDTFTSNS